MLDPMYSFFYRWAVVVGTSDRRAADLLSRDALNAIRRSLEDADHTESVRRQTIQWEKDVEIMCSGCTKSSTALISLSASLVPATDTIDGTSVPARMYMGLDSFIGATRRVGTRVSSINRGKVRG